MTKKIALTPEIIDCVDTLQTGGAEMWDTTIPVKLFTVSLTANVTAMLKNVLNLHKNYYACKTCYQPLSRKEVPNETQRSPTTR